jgi:hypothetical protein
MYTDDNRGRFPDPDTLGGCGCRRPVGERDPDDPTSLPEIYGWSALLDARGYLKVKRAQSVWVCPSASERVKYYQNSYWAWSMPGGPDSGPSPLGMDRAYRRQWTLVNDNTQFAPAKTAVKPATIRMDTESGVYHADADTFMTRPFDLAPHWYAVTVGNDQDNRPRQAWHTLHVDLTVGVYTIGGRID